MIDKKHKGRSTAQNLCPSCSRGDMEIFYRVRSVPTNSVLQVASREKALKFPTGDISLGFCSRCHFISNIDFQPELTEYSGEYESTQAFSPTFNTFNERLAQDLIERYNLQSKKIIEIGCGNGEFLNLMCETGSNSGLGFDPAYQEGRIVQKTGTRLEFVRDYYSEKYSNHPADFITCKMTLEHIKDVFGFLATIRRSVISPKTKIFIQVPDSIRILKDIAFWDIYYEHCSYFTLSTLSKALRLQNFDVIDLWKDYGDQYIMITATPGHGHTNQSELEHSDESELLESLEYFRKNHSDHLDYFRNLVSRWRADDQRAVVWGGGSKGVAFLTTLGIEDEILYAVDINPNKRGMFLPGGGQMIVEPDFLKDYKPDHVIVMNSIYEDEIRSTLNSMNLTPEILNI